MRRGPVFLVLPGKPESAGAARWLAQRVLGDDHPALETVMLVASELVTNAIMHSQSGAPDGTLTLTLCPGLAGVLVQVCDGGGSSEPRVADERQRAEHGYGLLLVDALSDSWGSIASPEGRVTWCRIGGRAEEAPRSTTGDAVGGEDEVGDTAEFDLPQLSRR